MTMKTSVFGGVTSYSAGSASMFQRNVLPVSSGYVSKTCSKGMLYTLSQRVPDISSGRTDVGRRIRGCCAPYSPLFLPVQQPHVTKTTLFLFSCTSSYSSVSLLFLVVYNYVVLCFLSVPFHLLVFFPSSLPNIHFQVHRFSCIEQDPPSPGSICANIHFVGPTRNIFAMMMEATSSCETSRCQFSCTDLLITKFKCKFSYFW